MIYPTSVDIQGDLPWKFAYATPEEVTVDQTTSPDGSTVVLNFSNGVSVTIIGPPGSSVVPIEVLPGG